MDLKRATYTLVFLISIVFILIIGKDIIMPIILAGLIWFLVREIRKLIQKIPYVGKKMPRWLLNLISLGLLYLVLGLVAHLVLNNIEDLTFRMDDYESKVTAFGTTISTMFNIDLDSLWSNFAGNQTISLVIDNLFASITGLLGNVFMIGLYLLFMLLEESIFGEKLKKIYQKENQYLEMKITLSRISDSISSYIFLKTMVCTLTGSLSYLALLIIGVDSPLFWAFLIFILTFIPVIGALIGVLFPFAWALLQFDTYNMPLVVLFTVGSIQLIIGNIIEPKIMGNSLNVSSFVVILALSFWGAIWGITGMVLSVPITVVLVILLGQFDATKKLAILLSEKGNIS